jgi:hypothetical protein
MEPTEEEKRRAYHLAAMKRYRERHPDRVKAYKKAYSQRPEVKEKARLAAARWRAEHPEKVKRRYNRESQAAAEARWKAKDPEGFKACRDRAKARYQAKHKDRLRVLSKEKYQKNKEQCKASVARWRANNRERVRVYRRMEMARDGGFAPPDYQGQPEAYWRALQGEDCAICGDRLGTGRKLHLDHDHTTGRIRGFLCNLCNAGLGHFADNEDILLRAISYLRGTAEPLSAPLRKPKTISGELPG